MQTAHPILSIVTICYNDLQGLKKTIESVEQQSSREFEYILIDGGSADGSREYLQEKQHLFSFWCSEKDKGIYDAQNKGIAKSRGTYLLFLNAGDTLQDAGVIDRFAVFYAQTDKGIIYGNSTIISEAGTRLLVPPEKIDLTFWYRNTLNHQAVFIRRELFDYYGMYDLQYRICADFDFFLKVYLEEPVTFIHFPHTVCNYYEEGFSADPANYDKMIGEKEQILKKQLSPAQYAHIRRAYVKTLPIRKQIVARIYQTPVLNTLFKKIYPMFSKGAKK